MNWLMETLMSSKAILLDRITQIPGQWMGDAYIRETQIRVSDVWGMLAENVGAAEILESFPDLELEDIKACLLFTTSRRNLPGLLQ